MLRNIILYFLSFLSVVLVAQPVSNYKNPKAYGKLMIQVKNDSITFFCKDLEVKAGEVNSCDTFQIYDHPYFITRNTIDSNWSVDLFRLYTNFPDISELESEKPWLDLEGRKSVKYKEDYTDTTQKSGVTYRHHENIKHSIFYNIANPTGKFYNNEKKYQFNYDWEENIKGKYEMFSVIGLKLFRHKYTINRIMAYNKNIHTKGVKYSIDVKVEGKIEEYHENGKKKTVVEYVDWFLVEKKEDDGPPTIVKKVRTGTRTGYHEKGKVKYIANFSIAGFEGKVEYYNLKGVVVKIEHYKDGVLHGKFQEMYDNGLVKIKGEYKQGEPVGNWIQYNEDGEKSF